MSESVRVPRLVIAGVSSGVGKTTLTVGIARALRARGLRVSLFKCGPDYLDPTYHARAAGSASQNLDGWMMGRDAVKRTFVEAARGSDLALVEGVMGLYDGASPTGEEGSTAEIAKWLAAPVVLVVDASGMARSIAALAAGYASFDPDLSFAGVIANRVGSQGHVELLRKALSKTMLFGGLPRDTDHAFAERHLGLHTADERALPDTVLDHWGARASERIGLDALLEAARAAPPIDADEDARAGTAARCRIGIAHDEAFHFYYADNLRRLEALGAELVRFSPIRDQQLPSVDGLYLGGGYPELHGAALARNEAMRAEVARFAERGGPVYAECGGLMYLTRAIRSLDGTRHPMVGLLPTEAQMFDKLQELGYVEVEVQASSPLGAAGTRFRGHQFRYSKLDPAPARDAVEYLYAVRRRRGGDVAAEGYRVGNVVASYVHAHWASNPRVAEAFVEACVRFGDRRGT